MKGLAEKRSISISAETTRRLSFFASYFGYSIRYLSRLIKRETKQGISQVAFHKQHQGQMGRSFELFPKNDAQ